MHRTLFDTPVLNRLLRTFSLLFFRFNGWKIEGSLPPGSEKCVVVAAPHTSNWDLPYGLMLSFALNFEAYWLGKVQLFRPPFRHLMMWFGGIPVQRDKSNKLVSETAHAIRQTTGRLQLIVSPEGTRSKTHTWRTGFYHIALEAGVPLVLAFLDYEKKIGGIGAVFHPSGDIEADMRTIKAFYTPIKGKNADQFHAG